MSGGAALDLRPMPQDRYTGFKLIGRGGMGLVYEVHDNDLERLVAMKVVRTGTDLRAGESGSPLTLRPPPEDTEPGRAFASRRARFFQEALITGALDHPNVLPVHDVGRTPLGVPYCTMRLAPRQRTFADEIRDRREEPIEKRLRLLAPLLDVCDAIGHAHSRGIIHRDVKPSNVALGTSGEVFVLDWGLAYFTQEPPEEQAEAWRERATKLRQETALETSDVALGSPGYMSPEAGQGNVRSMGPQSDVFSLGAMLYEILTGRRPFKFSNLYEYVAATLGDPPPDPQEIDADVPPGLSRLALACLSRDPAGRPADAGVLAGLLRQWQQSYATAVRRRELARQARESLDEAQGRSGQARLQAADRALVATQRLVQDGASGAVIERLSGQVRTQRRLGLAENVRADRRRQLVWGLMAVLIAAGFGWAIVDRMLERERRDAESARLATLGLEGSVEDMLSELGGARQEIEALKRDAESTRVEALGTVEGLHGELGQERERAETAQRGFEGERAKAQKLRRDLDAEQAKAEELEQSVALLRKINAEGRSGSDAERDRAAAGLGKAEADLARAQEVIAELRAQLKDLSLTARWSSERWAETIAGIAASPEYGGLEIARQPGLIPLGPDPDSGLFEFAHLGSGLLPTRDSGTGRLEQTEDAAIVLVLIPGGRFQMGAQSAVKASLNFDRDAKLDEAPPREVTLTAYFIAKYELTRSQWMALGGAHPAAGPGDGGGRDPVVEVSWDDCHRLLEQNGLVLPSEAQWECACRAGTDTPWHSGHSAGEALRRVANFTGVGGLDQFKRLAPVGRLEPNDFGLYDCHGNVAEWVRDEYATYRPDPPVDPVFKGETDGDRVFRGGGWRHIASITRSANRDGQEPGFRFSQLGARAARSLETD